VKSRLLKLYAEVYELERGGWLCKRKSGGWVVLDADGQEAKL
jgi:hypothetical protein